jgi:hypothetical protein
MNGSVALEEGAIRHWRGEGRGAVDAGGIVRWFDTNGLGAHRRRLPAAASGGRELSGQDDAGYSQDK